MAGWSDEIRVLYVIGGRRIGGMETHLLTLASSLPPSVRSLVCCLDASNEYRARLAALGIEHVDLRCPAVLYPRGLQACWRVRRLLRQFRPHVLHAYGFSADVFATMLRLSGAKARLVTSRRGEERNRRRQTVRRAINRLTDRIVCVSPETEAFVRATESPAPAILEVIPNGVAADGAAARPRTGPAGRPLQFGTLGTVKPIKGTDLLVDAFMQFPGEAHVELHIAGLIDRPWAEALRDRARADPRIRFSGRTTAPREFLRSLDVFVLPSRSEGMSNALLEAMATGLPCIATNVGSNRSVLCPAGEPASGLVTDVSPQSLFDAMRRLHSSADDRARLGAQAAAAAGAHHSVAAMVAHYERLYRTVTGLEAAPSQVREGASQGMTVDA